ncbi:MAG TPA: lipoprotein insertase outer membrane protein LolB [Comamonas sp.]
MGLQVHDPLAQEQSFSASFQLQGSPEQGSLDIFNPLGSQIAKLQWQPGTAWLQQGDRLTQSESLQELLRQSLGTALPVQALFSWLRGQEAVAQGWQVDLSRHAQGRITAQRTSPLPQATLRLVLQQPE